MSVVANITVHGAVDSVKLSNVRDDGAFLGNEQVSVNGIVVDRFELSKALAAITTAAEGDSTGW